MSSCVKNIFQQVWILFAIKVFHPKKTIVLNSFHHAYFLSVLKLLL
jgi:hypothetical protein